MTWPCLPPSLSPLPTQNHAGLPAAPAPRCVRCVYAAGAFARAPPLGSPPAQLPPASLPSFSVKPLWSPSGKRQCSPGPPEPHALIGLLLFRYH